MDKLKIFKKILEFAEDMGEVVDADMNYLPNMMMVSVDIAGQTATIEFSIKEGC